MWSSVCSSPRVKLCYQVLHLYLLETWGFSHLSHLLSPMEWVPLLKPFCEAHILLLLCPGQGSFFFFLCFPLFLFLLLLLGEGGILDCVPKHSLLSSHYDLWVWEKKMELALLCFPPSSISLIHGPQSAGRPQHGNRVSSTQILVTCRKDSRITRALLDELSTMA